MAAPRRNVGLMDTNSTEIRPFRVQIPQADLDDLDVAMEVPGLLVGDVRAFFRGLR